MYVKISSSSSVGLTIYLGVGLAMLADSEGIPSIRSHLDA
jgi:hypothetical protein